MADNTEKKVLISVEILDNFISAKKNVDQWKKALKDAEEDQNTTSEQYREIATNLAAANNQYKEAKKAIESASKSQDVLNAINAKTNKSLGEMRAELTALRNVPLDNLDEAEIREINQAMADLTSRIEDYKVEIKGLDTEQIFTNTAEGLQAIVSGVSALTSTFSVLGVENETFAKLQESTVQLIAAVQALGVVTEYLEKKKYNLIAANIKNIASNIQETLAKKLNTLQTIQQTGAENLSAAAKLKNTIAIKAITAAQWLWNAAMNANPIFLIITALAALATGIAFLALRTTESEKANRAAEAANAAYEKQIRKTQNTIDVITNKRDQQVEQLKLQSRKEIEELTKSGAKREVISKRQQEITNDIRRIEIESSNAIRKAKQDELKANEKSIEAEQNKLKTLKYNSKEYKEQIQLISDLVGKHESLVGAINSEYHKAQNLAQDEIEDERKRKEEGIRLAKERADKKFDSLQKQLEDQRKFNEQAIKAEASYQSDDFKKKQEYAEDLFDLNQNFEKRKLRLLLDNKRITKKEYNEELDNLKNAYKEFTNGQIKATNDYYLEQRRQLLNMIEKDTIEQIKDVNDKFDKAIKDLNNIQEPVKLIGQSDEEFQQEYEKYKNLMFENAAIAVQLEKQRQKEIDEINEAGLQKRLSDIEKAVSKEYQKELAKFTDNEREKNRVLQEQLKKQIEEKKKAGLQTYDDEAELRSLQSQANQLQLNSELLQANENARAKYEARKKYLEQEAKVYKDNADKQAEINEQMKQNDRELMESRIASVQKWAAAATELMSAANSLFSNMEQAEVQRYEEDNEQKKASLQARLDRGIISQEEYDAQIAAADAELEKKKNAAAKRQAIREKAMKVFEIGVNTATGIMKAVAESPLTFGLPWSAFVGATGALQLAAVLAEPLPKASKGMLLQGPSHALGGIPIEAEGGEAIINKRSTALFKPLLSAINVAGGGVPFVSAMSDGGYSARMAVSSGNAGLTKNEMQEIIRNMKVYTTVEDYRRADTDYTIIEDRGQY